MSSSLVIIVLLLLVMLPLLVVTKGLHVHFLAFRVSGRKNQATTSERNSGMLFILLVTKLKAFRNINDTRDA